MNKSQLVDALAERLGDRRIAASAVDGVLETIVETVRSGDPVSLTGFGVFEGRARAARTARNPRTGESVDVPATTVPAFRPGATFRSAVGGSGSAAPRSAPAPRPVRTAKASASFTARAAASGSASEGASGASAATTAPKAKATPPKASPKSGKAEKRGKAEKAKAVAPAKGGDKGAKADKGKKAKPKK